MNELILFITGTLNKQKCKGRCIKNMDLKSEVRGLLYNLHSTNLQQMDCFPLPSSPSPRLSLPCDKRLGFPRAAPPHPVASHLPPPLPHIPFPILFCIPSPLATSTDLLPQQIYAAGPVHPVSSPPSSTSPPRLAAVQIASEKVELGLQRAADCFRISLGNISFDRDAAREARQVWSTGR
jgi:hypothetical protein